MPNTTLLLELLEDEDSFLWGDESSSEEDEKIGAMQSIFCNSLNSRHCISGYFKVIEGYNDEEFKSNFRMSKEKFNLLSEHFLNSETYQDLLKNPSSTLRFDHKKSILIFLWFASHRVGYREVKDKFDISLSSAHEVITRVTMFLSLKAKDFIRLPTNEEMETTKQFFMECKGFPNIIGCIDGTHIKIDKPLSREVDYFNRKDYYSINVQAVCNERKEFIDVFIGYPGSVHDARVYKNSSLFEKLPNLCRNGTYLLGDSAYALSKYLKVPYKDNGHLTAQQKKFNFRLSSCRIYIEHTFGILKERFPQLYQVRIRGHKKYVILFGHAWLCIILLKKMQIFLDHLKKIQKIMIILFRRKRLKDKL